MAGEAEGNLKLYGEVINNTGAAQTLPNVRGTFYDSGGNEISEGPIVDYLPLELIPQGGQVPFALTAFGLHEAADFDLQMEAEPSQETLQHAFEFLEATSYESDGSYCLRAKVHNLGDELHSYLAIVAVLYDEQGNVINFDDHYEHLAEGLGGQALNFELCVDSLGQTVASYELRAWGL